MRLRKQDRHGEADPVSEIGCSCDGDTPHCGHDCPLYCLGAVGAQIEDLDRDQKIAVLTEALEQARKEPRT